MANTKMWIFQANLQKYDLLGALADPELENDVWKVSRYQFAINSGYLALIWKVVMTEEFTLWLELRQIFNCLFNRKHLQSIGLMKKIGFKRLNASKFIDY
jgi:hypothetical protein